VSSPSQFGNRTNFPEPRWKRYEKRKALKRAIWRAETSINDMAEMLHDDGYLLDWRTKDRAKIQVAFQKWINGNLRVRGCDVPEW
jgi:hypothetical protein